MAHGEFLRLLQMTETGRKVDRQDSIEILDADVAKAQELDEMERTHLEVVGEASHDGLSCVECVKVSGGRVEQRESLHSRGVDFPVEVLASR